KEASDLMEAAAALPLALTSASPRAELEDDVVRAVQREAGKASGRHPAHGRFRTAVAAGIAAFIAVAALGWGAVMAGRAERFSDRAKQAVEQQKAALANFQSLLATIPGSVPQDHPRLGELSPTPEHGTLAGGAALMLTSGSGPDYAFVILSGADEKRLGPLPYRVYLEDASKSSLLVGRITQLDNGGGAQLIRPFGKDLLPFSRVVVRDANGRAVMQGTIGTDTPQSAR
ncbi:MAG: hypothetical protein M3O88_09110, partial [Actinomycetota bacterium]|nr:hypothetical protein [Actinomycetota bacterium]